MNDFENSYKKPKDFYKEKSSSSFGKNVVIPFVSGIIGASLVVGVSFGVPQVKDKLLNTEDILASISVNKEISAPENILQNTTTTDSSNTGNSAIMSLSSYSEATAAIAKKVQPSIVGITVTYSVNSFFGQSLTGSAGGSGIIMSEDGYILTNSHVVNTSNTSNSTFYEISDATSIKVYLYGDSTAYDAKIVGEDAISDIAVLKIEKTGLTAAEFGDSSSVQAGSFAMVIGNPLGLENSVTLGTVSAVNREVTDNEGTKRVLIQTDAAINSGNSGGALVNANGQVIGVNEMKASATGVEGIGFAIPINTAKEISDELIQYGKIRRPYIGISGITIDETKSKYYSLPIGVYIKEVEDFSSAQKAGLKTGDVILSIDGKVVTSMNDLNDIKYSHSIGDTITLKINRDGTEMDISLTLSEQP